ncbi:MAG: hypothetical protein LBU51_10725 [Bacteroidales bacterium]|jgi:membrane protein DedA with SNARE-associated domain|nr:hypothetical protein [Bacteroidales bacterium]
MFENILQHAFRFVILLAVGIVPIYFLEIDHKTEIMTGWLIGATLAFIVGNIVLKIIKNKKSKKV